MKIILLMLITSFLNLNTQKEIDLSDFKGKWHSEQMDNMVIYIYKAKDGYWYGKIVGSDKKSNIGKLMLKKLSPNKEQNKLTGKVRKPETGFEANVTLELKQSNQLKMTTHILLMSRTFDLRKVKN